MTEKEKQEIINIVHRTVLGFFDTSLDEERYLTETEKTLLEVNKAICNGVKEMPTVERPHGEWIDVNGDGSLWKCSNCNEKSCCRGNFCSDCGSDNRPRENTSSSMIINGKYSENVEYGTRIEIGKMKGR